MKFINLNESLDTMCTEAFNRRNSNWIGTLTVTVNMKDGKVRTIHDKVMEKDGNFFVDRFEDMYGTDLVFDNKDDAIDMYKSFVDEFYAGDDKVDKYEVVYEEDKLEEDVDLTKAKNTIAYAISKNIEELGKYTDAVELRDAIIKVLDDSDIADTKAVERFKKIIMQRKSVSALLSTLGTFATGMKTK